LFFRKLHASGIPEQGTRMRRVGPFDAKVRGPRGHYVKITADDIYRCSSSASDFVNSLLSVHE
jgi:hypothetical protein